MKPKTRDIDTTVLIFGAIIFAGIAGIYFIGSSISAQEDKVEQIKVDIQSEYLRRDRYKELLTLYQQVEAEGISGKLSSLLPSSENFLDVVRELESIAQRSGNQLVMRLGEAKLTSDGIELPTTQGQPRPTVLSGSGNYDYIQIEATLRGNHASLLDFIELFNQAKYFMNIDSIVVNRIDNAGSKYIDSQLQVRVFVQKIIRTPQRR